MLHTSRLFLMYFFQSLFTSLFIQFHWWDIKDTLHIILVDFSNWQLLSLYWCQEVLGDFHIHLDDDSAITISHFMFLKLPLTLFYFTSNVLRQCYTGKFGWNYAISITELGEIPFNLLWILIHLLPQAACRK